MSESKWVFDEIGKGREDAYFKQKEAELIAELRRKAERERTRTARPDESGVDDEILKTLQDLGFTREVLAILHLVPLVQVAWADGRVSEAERKKIIEVAGLRGVVPGAPEYDALDQLLARRPSEETFETIWRVLRALYASWPEEKRKTIGGSLPAYATEVASVSGGLLGFRSISAEESDVLQRVAREIAEAHAEAARKVTLAGSDVGKKLV
jgi:hypothetical protein